MSYSAGGGGGGGGYSYEDVFRSRLLMQALRVDLRFSYSFLLIISVWRDVRVNIMQHDKLHYFAIF